MKKGIYQFCLLLLGCCLLFISCKKDSFNTSPDAALSTSIDSLKFDTVFTSVGSITQSFKINNNNDQKLRLSKVKLMGGSASAFTININGFAQPEADNIDIAANDSLYVFVTVNINPTTANLPFIIQDSIQIQYNGTSRYVQLQAYGQNAHFLKGQIISVNTTWNNDLPYVILDSLKINPLRTLTINKGCRIYAHANAPIIVDGRLRAIGEKDQPVIFSGDRLDESYKDLPASWPGIYFRETSFNNSFVFAIVKNAYQAIVSLLPSTNANPKVSLQQCIIDNAYDAGILAVNSRVAVNNSLISNCGANIGLYDGGNYTFTNCTVASYGNRFIEHKKPVLQLTNYIEGYATNTLSANFTNCIFWGSNGNIKDEIAIVAKTDITPTILFNNCIYKVDNTDPSPGVFSNSLKNADPLFDSIDVTKRYFDFHTNLKPSPGVDAGAATALPDLDNNPRNGIPDIGAYEKQ